MPGGSKENSQNGVASTPIETRRTKRKANELRKPPAGTATKRHAVAANSQTAAASRKRQVVAKKTLSAAQQSSRSTPAKTPVGTPKGKVATKPKKISSSCNIATKSAERDTEQQKDVISMLQHPEVVGHLVSAVSAQFRGVDGSQRTDGDDGQSDVDQYSPTEKRRGHGSRRDIGRRVSANQSSRHTSSMTVEREDTEEREQEPDVPGEVDYEGQNQQDEEDEEQEEDEDPSAHGPEKEDDDDDADHEDLLCQQVGSTNYNRGESDGEMDVSFHNTAATDDDDDETSAANVGDVPMGTQKENVNSQPNSDDRPNVLGAPANDKDMDLSMLNSKDGLDGSVLLTVVQSLKKAIFTEVHSSLGEIMNEIRSDRDNNKKLREHISELTSIVSTTASAIFIKHAATTPRAKEIQHKLCLVPAFFSDNIMLKILPRVVMGFFFNNIVSGSPYSIIEMKGVEFWNILFFSKKPKEKKKEKYSSEVGQFYSKFRYSLLSTSVLAMQDNCFQTFRPEGNENGALQGLHASESAETSTVGPSLAAMKQPHYLKPGYILETHLVSAANKQEMWPRNDLADESNGSPDSQPCGENESTDMLDSSQSSGKPKRSGSITKDEIATEAASMVYRIITSVLYRARNASKTQLFHDIGYLFTGWKQHTAPVSQNHLKIYWEKQKSLEIDYIEDLPRTKLVHPNERHLHMNTDRDKIDLDNVTHLETLICNHPELSLIIEHAVMVNGSERRLRCRINLVEVVCRFLASYCTLQSAA